jgi:hypothetical protein
VFNKIVLILILGMILAGAATTSTSNPVLVGMGGLILLALYVAMRRDEQG